MIVFVFIFYLSLYKGINFDHKYFEGMELLGSGTGIANVPVSVRIFYSKGFISRIDESIFSFNVEIRHNKNTTFLQQDLFQEHISRIRLK